MFQQGFEIFTPFGRSPILQSFSNFGALRIAEQSKIAQQLEKTVEHLNDLPYDRLVSFFQIAEQFPIAQQFSKNR